MNRSGHNDVRFFTGVEVEHTPAFGKLTLFVVGTPSQQEVQDWLDDFASYEDQSKHIEHIFFGANHSFDPKDNLEWARWEGLVGHFLAKGYLCSLDIPISAVESFNDSGLCEYNNFVPQIRVSIPYVKLWNYNTMVKIDDNDFNATNPGVWTHSLHSLMTRRTFTDWNQYSKDQPL
jgi:hypothetical protein